MTSTLDLLCLPCAGASATMYLRWRRLLPEWMRLVPVELPGRGTRLGENRAENFDALVAQLCEEKADSLAGRYALFGHSMGALLAYGIAQRQRVYLRKPPLALLVSGCPAPARRDPKRFADKDSDAALIADLRRQGGTPEAVFASPELLRMALDTLGPDYRLCASFRHRAARPLSVPIRVFAGRHDAIERSAVQAWRAETTAGCTEHWFDGGHFFIREHEPAMLALIVRQLARTEPDGAANFARQTHAALGAE